MILADDCVVIEYDELVIDFMESHLTDNERFDFAKEYGAKNV